MKCPQCKKILQKKIFDIGYGIEVPAKHCTHCGFNITDDKMLDRAIIALKEQMSKEVKVIKIGTGLGIRLPNDMVKNYNLKKGEEIRIKPERDGIKLITV